MSVPVTATARKVTLYGVKSVVDMRGNEYPGEAAKRCKQLKNAPISWASFSRTCICVSCVQAGVQDALSGYTLPQANSIPRVAHQWCYRAGVWVDAAGNAVVEKVRATRKRAATNAVFDAESDSDAEFCPSKRSRGAKRRIVESDDDSDSTPPTAPEKAPVDEASLVQQMLTVIGGVPASQFASAQQELQQRDQLLQKLQARMRELEKEHRSLLKVNAEHVVVKRRMEEERADLRSAKKKLEEENDELKRSGSGNTVDIINECLVQIANAFEPKPASPPAVPKLSTTALLCACQPKCSGKCSKIAVIDKTELPVVDIKTVDLASIVLQLKIVMC